MVRGRSHRTDDVRESLANVALPRFYHYPARSFEQGALAPVTFPVQLELASPELGVGLREVRVAARAVVPVAAVDEDRELSTRVDPAPALGGCRLLHGDGHPDDVLDELVRDPLDQADDEGVAHHECTLAV
jgi:hypothetical protein